jgi:DNA-binding response OmpR family regulator
MSPTPVERILVVESDPDVSDLIARQALQPLGYQVSVASDSGTAVRQAVQFQPDVILANLNLPGLSGKDLLVALSSQGIMTPVIVLAEKGHEPAVIQAFRLGAADYLMLPAREAEMVSAVERALKQGRDMRARENLDAELKRTNAELQHRLRDLTTIFSVGRAVISITDQRVLFEKIAEAVTSVAEADMGWLTLKNEKTNSFLLVAHRNLPEAWAKKMGQPLNDGVSTLVAMSAETLSIHGSAMLQFQIATLGKAAMVVPIKAKNDAIGLITVVRKAEKPFAESEQALLGAIADYASISLVNSQLFRALAQNMEAAQSGEKRKNELLQNMQAEAKSTLQMAVYPLDLLLTEKMGPLTKDQKQALGTIQVSMKRLLALVSEKSTQPPAPKV